MVDSKRWEGKNIFGENIFEENIFDKNISHPAIHPLHTTPTPSYLLFEVEGGDEQTKRTHGPDGAHNDCSFYCIRLKRKVTNNIILLLKGK